ncbi:MAG: hypothetical protein QX199_18995 [Methylococcaceae bacterium]
MLAQSRVFIEYHDVKDQLSALNLTSDLLTEPVKKGQAARNNATENDPSNAAGTMAFFATVRASRELLIPLGWEKREIRNLSLISNPKTSVSIVVATGDNNVGIKEVIPKTKNPKGKQAELYISTNCDIFSDDIFSNDDFTDQSIDTSEFQTWVLMYYLDVKENQIRLELSLPTDQNIRGQINSWKERVILDPILLDGIPPLNFNSPSPDFNNLQDFDVPVKRRQK